MGLVNQHGQTVAVLQPTALSACILGRASWALGLRQRILFPNDEVDLVPAIPSPQCRHKLACQRNLCFVLGELIAMGTSDMGSKLQTFPTNLEFYFMTSDGLDIYFCDCCKVLLETTLERQQHTWWTQLPGNFNLPAWEMIKDFDML